MEDVLRTPLLMEIPVLGTLTYIQSKVLHNKVFSGILIAPCSATCRAAGLINFGVYAMCAV